MQQTTAYFENWIATNSAITHASPKKNIARSQMQKKKGKKRKKTKTKKKKQSL